MQMSVQRVKRLFSWWSDAYGAMCTEVGALLIVPANHCRRRYHNQMAPKRNWGRKPRKRLRRSSPRVEVS